MGFVCCVPGCNTSGQKGIQMHRFPNDKQVCDLWLRTIRRLDLKDKPLERIRALHRICNIHFGADASYVGTRYKSLLKKHAVPSQLLGNSVELAFTAAQEAVDLDVQSSSKMVPTNFTKPDAPEASTLSIEQPVTHPTNNKGRTGHVSIKISTPAKISSLRKRVNLLSYTATRNATYLTPKARKYYKIATDLRKTARRLNFNCDNLKDKVKNMEEMVNSPSFLRSKLNKPTYDFVMCQLRCQKIHPKGRRFSLDEKILYLTFLKQSPKGYKLFRKIFAAPSRKTLTNLLQKVPFSTGINKIIMDSLKAKVDQMTETEKLCSIVFDEMQLDPSLQLNRRNDIFEGFQDNGEGDRHPFIADKVMVFMVRGICRKWKQPISYYFNEGGMKTNVLAKTIKEVVRSCQDVGLNVKTIICDQGSANIAAINKLYDETKEYFIRKGEENKIFGVLIGDTEIVPLYDCPHLLKSLRNNFFKYKVLFKWNKEVIEHANWDHIVKLFEVEQAESDDYKLCKKLTLHHVNNTKKIKVSVAAQVFSNSVAAVLNRIAGTDGIPKEAKSTAELLLFMDKVFDSVNGAALPIQSGKKLRCAVTETSGHMEFWMDAIKVFQSMCFINNKNEKLYPPSIRNWIHTLKGFLYLWKKLSGEGVKFLCSRNLNQDPLENFFGRIRSHGIRNINPNAASFVNSFKSLIINNYLSNHTSSFNCESDDLQGLDDLKLLLTTEALPVKTAIIKFPEISIPEFKPEYCSLLKKGKLTYIAGFVAKKAFQKIKLCSQCRKDLLSADRSSPEYFLIQTKAYSPNALLAPSTNFNIFFQKCISVLSHILPQVCHYPNLSKILKLVLKNLCKDDIFTCDNHDMKDFILDYTSKFHSFVWIKNINAILKGKQTLGNTSDPIKINARKKFEAHQKFAKKIQTVKGLNIGGK